MADCNNIDDIVGIRMRNESDNLIKKFNSSRHNTFFDYDVRTTPESQAKGIIHKGFKSKNENRKTRPARSASCTGTRAFYIGSTGNHYSIK